MLPCKPARLILILLPSLASPALSLHAEQPLSVVKKTAAKSTLNQPGTPPFHLKATLSPSLSRDAASGRTGSIEIWWKSPTLWRRELTAPNFHQVAISNQGKEWQQNQGDYLPEWLNQVAIAIVDPAPAGASWEQYFPGSEDRKLAGSSYYQWAEPSTDGTVTKTIGATFAITDSTGLLFYDGGLGWGALYKDYQKFHHLEVARTVTSGSPEVTAKITLEDLPQSSDSLFQISSVTADPHPIRTVIVPELTMRALLAAPIAPQWPPVENGPTQGILTCEIIIDRAGKVRDIGNIISDNGGMDTVAHDTISDLTFKPYLINGEPVQVITRITLPFKTVRPAGQEAFDSARDYFEHGRQRGFISAASAAPYRLKATFQAGSKHGVETGDYTDTWLDATHWRREISFDGSSLIRAHDGDKYFVESKGDPALLNLLLRVIEPIPSIDTFVESDWRIKRDNHFGPSLIRVMSGYEDPQGNFDPQHSRGYWFNGSGQLIGTYFNGFETTRSQFTPVNGIELPETIKLLKDSKLVCIFTFTPPEPITADEAGSFSIKGHDSQHTFTSEQR